MDDFPVVNDLGSDGEYWWCEYYYWPDVSYVMSCHVTGLSHLMKFYLVCVTGREDQVEVRLRVVQSDGVWC